MQERIFNHISLCTTQNELLKDLLEKMGFTVSSFLNIDLLKAKIDSNFNQLLLLSYEKIEENNPLPEMPYFLLSETDSLNVKNFAISQGICNVLMNSSPREVCLFTEEMSKKPVQKGGTFLIYDTNSSRRKLISLFLETFGFRVEKSTNIEEIINRKDYSGVEFICLSLCNENLNISRIAKAHMNNSTLRNIPFLVYKDEDEGIYIHELISGLKKITRAVFTTEELLKLLISLIEKSALIPITTRINDLLQLPAHIDYSEKTLPRVYKEYERTLLSHHHCLGDECFDDLFKANELLQRSLIRMMGIRWLSKGIIKNKTSNAGACG